MRAFQRAVVALAILPMLAACGDDDVNSPQETGRIRAVHAIADVPNADVLLNTTSYKTNLAFKGTDGYKQVTPATWAVKFRKTGQAQDLVSANATIANGTDRTVIAVGSEDDAKTIVLNDNTSAPAAGKVKIRFVHGVVGGEAVDAYVLEDILDLTEATPVKTNLAALGTSDFVTGNAGTYVLVLTQAGTKTPVLTVNNVQIAALKVRTVVVVEKAGGGAPYEAIVLADN